LHFARGTPFVVRAAGILVELAAKGVKMRWLA